MTPQELAQARNLIYSAVLGDKSSYLTFITGMQSGLLIKPLLEALGKENFLRFIYLVNVFGSDLGGQ